MAKQSNLNLRLKAVDRMSTAIDRVQKKFPKLTKDIKRASLHAKLFNAQTKSMRQNLTKLGGGMKRVGAAMTLGVTLPLTAAAAQGVKSFGDFQQGLRGVEKTTGLSRKQVDALGMTFDQLSTEIPVSTAELLELAQAGGQLGVSGAADLEKFTTTMAKLGRASDVAGEDGAKSIARILTVTGDGIQNIDRFSASLVDLGNNAAASESEILEVANRVAGQIGRFDVGSDKVLGISTALKALGKNAEASGSVIGRAFDAIDQSIKKGAGNKQTKLLSKLTGIAAKDLKKAFATDAAGVFQKFIGGLSKVEKGNGNVVKVMGALGLQGVRINDILGTLAKQPQVLAENMNRAGTAFKKNTALEKEFAVQTDSFNSEMKTLGNTFTSLLRLVGKELAPAVKFFGQIFKGIFNFLRNNPTMRTIVIVFGAFMAVLGPVLLALGAFLVILPTLLTGLAALGITTWAAAAPFLIIPVAIAAFAAALIAVMKNWDSLLETMAGSDNIFANIVGFLMSMVDALGKFIGFLAFAVTSLTNFKQLSAGFSEFLKSVGIGGDDEKKGLGAAVGARNQSKGVGQGPLRTEPFQGNLAVDFRNAPQGTKVRSEASGPIGLDVGFAGGLQ